MSRPIELELHATSGGSILLLFSPPAWAGHVHFRLLGTDEIDLGNLDVPQFESRFSPWFADRGSMSSAGTIENISFACLAMFSPHQYVCYGSLSPSPHELLIEDAKNSPVRIVARLQLDLTTVATWRRLLSA